MGQQGDDIVSLPAPPPPNPAARRAGIDAAMRKFDGIEDVGTRPTPPRRQGIFDWAASHKRATGGLVTAALIAIVGIPAIQVALRDQQQEIASEQAAPGPIGAGTEPVPDNAAADVAETPVLPEATVPVARSEPVETPEVAPERATEERAVALDEQAAARKARPATVAPMTAPSASPFAAAPPPPAPPPPPPPPPSAPMAERETADAVAAQSGNIVVTGSRVRRQELGSAAPVAVTAESSYAEFDRKLQSAFRSNDRKAILGLVGLPLQVNFNGDVRTYRRRGDVDRDFARIFTPAVRASVLSGQATRHLSISQSGGSWRIRAVRP